MSELVEVEVDEGPAHEDGVSMRFKRVRGAETHALEWVEYESDDGLRGRWWALRADSIEGPFEERAAVTQVEDSSDGATWLVTGGRHGVLMRHQASGAEVRVPYLVLALHSAMGIRAEGAP